MSGSTQKYRIPFYHPLSCVVVIQALPSASPAKCVISGSVLVFAFTFTLSSTASLPQEIWMFISHTYQMSIVWSWVGSVFSLLTETISTCSTLVPFDLLSLLAVTFVVVILSCLSLPILFFSMASDGSREPQKVLLLA